jgi:hypothetical protein
MDARMMSRKIQGAAVDRYISLEPGENFNGGVRQIGDYITREVGCYEVAVSPGRYCRYRIICFGA